MSTRQQGTAPSPQTGFPFGRNFAVEISSDNYKEDAILVLSDEQGTPVARYRVGSRREPILDQIVALVFLPTGDVQFQFSLTPATPAQIAIGYITGTYTFTFIPPGSTVTSFGGSLSDPRKTGPTGAEDEWTARGGGPDDEDEKSDSKY